MLIGTNVLIVFFIEKDKKRDTFAQDLRAVGGKTLIAFCFDFF